MSPSCLQASYIILSQPYIKHMCMAWVFDDTGLEERWDVGMMKLDDPASSSLNIQGVVKKTGAKFMRTN